MSNTKWNKHTWNMQVKVITFSYIKVFQSHSCFTCFKYVPHVFYIGFWREVHVMLVAMMCFFCKYTLLYTPQASFISSVKQLWTWNYFLYFSHLIPLQTFTVSNISVLLSVCLVVVFSLSVHKLCCIGFLDLFSASTWLKCQPSTDTSTDTNIGVGASLIWSQCSIHYESLTSQALHGLWSS